MTLITAVLGDITQQHVDAVVNAASREMRGGSGVDGAIHRAGGASILAQCISRFPHGLATGDAGWTTAGDLPVKWVIHTVGPNRHAGETDRSLLASCYRRSLEVADELGVATVAFPIIGAGAYGWDIGTAVETAVQTLVTTPTQVHEITLVTPHEDALRTIEAQLLRV